MIFQDEDGNEDKVRKSFLLSNSFKLHVSRMYKES